MNESVSHRGVLWAVIVVLCAKWCFELSVAQQQDFVVYLDAARRLVSGQALYGPLNALPFTYPPLAALAFVPVCWLPNWLAGAAWICLNLVLTVYLVKRIGVGLPAWMVLLLAFTAPFARSVYLGQINLVLFVLIWGSIEPIATSGRAWRIGLAGSVKITPSWLAVRYVITRQWTALALAIGTALGGVALAWLLTPEDSWWYWTSGIWDTGRVGGGRYPDNQSIAGLVARVSPAAPTVVLVTVSALVAVVAIAAGWRWRSDALRCLVALGLGGVLITPVSWSHHFLWLSVMVAVLWRDGRPRWSVTLLVVMLAEPIVMDGLTQWAPPLVNALAGSTYTLCAVAALGYLVTAPAAPARDERAPLAESVAA